MYLSEIHEGWKDLDGKTARKIEREEKKMKTDLMKIKSLRFGKAGNSKLTRLEEMIVSGNTRKLLEMEEIRLNLEKYSEIPKGWKKGNGWKISGKNTPEQEESDHWKSLARNMRIIDKQEKWLEPGWLEASSLEEQRTFLYGGTERQKEKTSQASLRLSDMDMKEDAKIGGKKVHQLAGIFQREGNEMQELRKGATDLDTCTRLRLNTTDHKDARIRCIGEMKTFENIEDKKTSREEDIDKAEAPRIDRKMLNFSLLNNEDNGRKPATRDVIDNLEATKTSTHTTNTVKDLNSEDNLQGKISEMHLPSLPSLTTQARRLTNSEMRCLERSPGGGRVIKTKLGTPRNQQVSAIRKLFEKQTTGGNIELLWQSTQDTNLNLGEGLENQFRTRQKESFCVGQPDGVYLTGPRQTCGTLFRPDSDWPSQPELGRCSQSPDLCDDQPRERPGK